MGKRQLVIGTGNPKKLREMQALLANLDLEILSAAELLPDLPSPEETGTTFDENSAIKAIYFATHANMLCIADDSGLEVDALGGAPGVYSSRYGGEDGNDELNNTTLLQALKEVPDAERGAQFRTVISLADSQGVLWSTEAAVRGRILPALSGADGFGYDPLFYYEPFGKTFAEVPLAQKTSVSHRGQAMTKLSESLDSILKEYDAKSGRA